MADLSFLEMLNAYPLAGVMVIVMLLLVQQTVRLWLGRNNVAHIESENNKLAKQTSATVNECSAKTHKVVEKLDELLQTYDVRPVLARLDHAIQLLEKVVSGTNVHERTLDRVAELCHDIDRDLRSDNSAVEHSKIRSKLENMEHLLTDIKRISILAANK